ncbi:MAG TPA: hypothetical protein VLF94_04805 [Chlamydiales bacterium]|nr:hypothetical protein [Chlamydiales bacterium]
MGVVLNNKLERAQLRNRQIDTDEMIVRQELVWVWTRVLERYARPGMWLPSPDQLRQELLDVGVDAAVAALCSEHWFFWSFMIRDEIEGKIRNGLARFEIVQFIEDVGVAQHDAGMLNYLREKIYRYVMEDI